MRPGKTFAKVLLVLGVSCFSACVFLPKSSAEYAEDFLSDLKARRFRQIYANSAVDITERCPEVEFVRRMETLREEIKKLDPAMQWAKNFDLGNTAEGRKRLSESDLLFAYREIVAGEKELKLLLYWTDQYGPVRLVHITAMQTENNNEVGSFDIPRTCTSE